MNALHPVSVIVFVSGLILSGCAPDPVAVLSVDGPDTLSTHQSGRFTATIASGDDPSQPPGYPVQYEWRFGDGSTEGGTLKDDGAGRSVAADHAFSEGGSYTVEFVAQNRDGANQNRGSSQVWVVAPPAVLSMNSSASDQTVEVGAPVTFRANVQGTPPFNYKWTFGDGTTSNAEHPSHTYESPGTQTVQLEVSNRAGSDRRSIHMTIEKAVDPCEQIADLNTVYFAFDKSNLDQEAQELLDENMNRLGTCPNMGVRVNAYTDHVGSDTYNLRLSERRARSVEAYYTTREVVPSRLTTRGFGKAPTPCLKDDPGPGCRTNRRAESIPAQ